MLGAETYDRMASLAFHGSLISTDAQGLIAPDVQVADQIITFGHVKYLRAIGDLADRLHPWV